MLYQHSLEIQERLETVLGLIESGQFSTPALAREVGVSIPTVSRTVAALRERGHDIRARKEGNGWRYILARRAVDRTQQRGGSGKGQRMALPNGPSD
jgi:biotin operon repressor